jgi:DMSO/TMAO reductase YedYZ heme-binding membrane subunit
MVILADTVKRLSGAIRRGGGHAAKPMRCVRLPAPTVEEVLLATTRSRSYGREHARPSSGGVAAEHATKIYAVAIAGIVITIAFLALTSIGRVVDAATQHFMLFYAGVFALIALCTSVGLGLVATDRMFMNPGRRVFVQAGHRAASFGAVTFLIIHIVTEILAQRVHVLDAVVPFLSPFRTFYIGIGTISSDLIILLVITGIMRGRFNARGNAWRWRAIHYTAYVSFVFGVWHGLLGGRPGKPYVDWSYGFVVAFVAVGLAVRILSNSLRPKENLSGPAVDMTASSASAPMRAAAMFAQAGASRGIGQQRAPMLSVASEPVLSAPVSVTRAPAPMLAAPVPAGAPQAAPFYEPGYEGPPRYLGAPRDGGTGPMPRAATGAMPVAAGGPLSLAGGGSAPAPGTGPWQQGNDGGMAGWGADQRPGSGTGSQPRLPTGPMPRPGSGPMQRPATGSMPRAVTGSFPRTEPGQRPGSATGSQPRLATGPMPRPGTGPMPTGGVGPMDATGPMDAVGGQQSWQPQRGPAAALPRADSSAGTGSWPAAGAGQRPGSATGSQPRLATGPMPRPGTGPMPRGGSGPMPRGNSGPQPRPGTGPMQRPQTGPVQRPQTGPIQRPQTGAMPSAASGPMQRPQTGPIQRPQTGPVQRPQTGAMPSAASGPMQRPQTGPMPRAGGGTDPYGLGEQGNRAAQPGYRGGPGAGGGMNNPQAPWDGGFPDTDPNLRYREPGPGMPGYRGSRDHRYGGDVR